MSKRPSENPFSYLFRTIKVYGIAELMRWLFTEFPRTIGLVPRAKPKYIYDAWYEDNEDFSKYKTDIKAIAFYLPQFHAFKENDEWWGKGFTEWTNTRKSKPRFPGHYQPREPHPDIGYYDLSDWHVMQKQAALAKQHGIYGFCFYHYWFSGKRLMEKPVDQFLQHPEIDIPFCLCWANENWSRRWDGGDSEILIAQGYENDSLQYIIDLKKYIDDPRYIRVDGKPEIIVYRPGLLPNAPKTFTRWREWARHNGIGEMLIWVQRGMAWSGSSVFVDGADAEIEFPPSMTAGVDQCAPLRIPRCDKNIKTYNYNNIVTNVLKGRSFARKFKHKVFKGIMLGWDNAARRKNDFVIWSAFSLAAYYCWLKYIVDLTRKQFNHSERFIFINAWNEWAEGTYLEPDKQYGYSSLNTTSKALFNLPLNKPVLC